MGWQYFRAMNHLVGKLSRNRLGIRRGAEVGVCRGDMAKHLLNRFPNLSMVLVDVWDLLPPEGHIQQQDGHENFAIAMKALEPFWPRWHAMKCHSIEAAGILLGAEQQFDFVFIDADHGRAAVRDDVAAWWPLVRRGGVLCGHDYGGKARGVKRAVDKFANRRNLKVEGHKGHVWSIWKP